MYLESGGQSTGETSSSSRAQQPPPAPGSVSYFVGSLFHIHPRRFDQDHVRAPDPSRRQRLVGGSAFEGTGQYSCGRLIDIMLNTPNLGVATMPHGFHVPAAVARHINDPFRDFAAEAGGGGGASAAEGSSTKHLNRLFQPPQDLMFHGSFNDVGVYVAIPTTVLHYVSRQDK